MLERFQQFRTAAVRFLSLGVCVALALVEWTAGRGNETGPQQQTVKKLIEFGSDEPDTTFLRQHIAEMERTPFDGCVFHLMSIKPGGTPENFNWLCWGRRAFTESELKPALEDLQATAFSRFTHNFLRFNTTPADLDWFDDFTAVLNNARLAAQIARQGKCEGILFDTEQYQGELFNYERQRDATKKSWDHYAAQARVRGRELMEAFQNGFPNLTVFLTFGYSLPRSQSENGKNRLAECSYGLLAPFLDGMVEAARGSARLVDGYETSYGYKEQVNFNDGYHLMKKGVLPIVADKEKYQRVASAGFGIWMDFDCERNGWDSDDVMKNYFTPEAFERSVRLALETTDEYVWIFTVIPRWWSAEGKALRLPAAYDRALRQARKGLAADN